MSYRNDNSGGAITIVFAMYFFLYIVSPVIFIFFELDIYLNIYFLYAVIFAGLIVSTIFGIVSYKRGKKISDLESKLHQNKYEYDKSISSLKKKHQEQEYFLKKQIDTCKAVFNNNAPFAYSASLYADMKVAIFEQVRTEMISKSRPAWKSAEKVAELSKKAKDAIERQRAITYRLEFLLQTFPEIRRYIDDDEALISLSESDSYRSFTEERDRSRDFLSEDEWKRLSVDERNQVALDRWKNSPKSNWTIGMLYEMYIGHMLRPKKFDVIQFGIINGLNDLGRDIIAKRKDSDGIERIYIIQCKNWSQKKEIHENVVCQLFGTAMEYQINHKCTEKQKVIPTLYVTTSLSPTAEIFAKRLGVLVHVEPLGDFPVIKCNINNGTKIYHLPFDQQYWNTKIENDGEFYASSISEAVSKGFRRAFRHKII